MIVDVATLALEGRRLKGTEPASILELDQESFVRTENPVRFDLTASVADGNVVVRGAVEADISLQCVRCAEFYPVTIRDESFMRVFEDAEDSDEVDLTPDIRESIILGFPTRPLCGPECKGLCAQCGADLNKNPCKCVPSSLGGAWDALDKIKLVDR